MEELKKRIVDEVKEVLQSDIYIQREMQDSEIRDVIKEEVFKRLQGIKMNVATKKELVDSIYNSIKKLDLLQPLIDDPTITEIMINGARDIFIEKNGRVEKLEVGFENKRILENLIQKIVSEVNRVVNEATPIVDARLSNGSRVNIVLPPVAINGPIVTIRKFPEKPMTIDQLIKFGAITSDIANVLESLVRAKYNIFISGGTGSGKTTFLNALSNFIPKDERIITIEDSAELQIVGLENLVKLETRNANTEGTGEITMRDLIKSSLRMRPDRIVVGEVRGAEALDMLQAMNTGHDGSLSTGHANSTEDMISRIETMVLTGANFPIQAIQKQIASAIDIIIHLGRLRDRSRKVLEITEVVGYKDGEIILNPLYIFEEDPESTNKKVISSLVRTNNKLVNQTKIKMAGIKIEI